MLKYRLTKLKDLKKSKCLLSFFYHINLVLVEKFFYIFHFIRKKKYWSNFGFFIPKNTNINYNLMFYEGLVNFNLTIPQDLILDFIRSRIGRVYFKFFFKFINEITYFLTFFVSFVKQSKKLMKIRLRHRKIFSKSFYKNLRFFKINEYNKDIKELYENFNLFYCNKIIKNMNLKKKKSQMLITNIL